METIVSCGTIGFVGNEELEPLFKIVLIEATIAEAEVSGLCGNPFEKVEEEVEEEVLPFMFGGISEENASGGGMSGREGDAVETFGLCGKE